MTYKAPENIDMNATDKCACCDKELKMYCKIEKVNEQYVNLNEGLMYKCGCWCGRHWCSDACADKDDWIFIGDSYETDYVGCKYCHDKNRAKFIPARLLPRFEGK